MAIADNLYDEDDSFEDEEFEEDEEEEDDDTSNVDPAERAADYVGHMAWGKRYMEYLMDIVGNDPEVIKKAFVYIEKHKQERFKEMEEVINIPGYEHKPEAIKNSYGYIDEDKEKHIKKFGESEGRFLVCDKDYIRLLTVYFLLKYPDVKPQERTESLAERLKKQGFPEEEVKEETEIMQWYEDKLIRNFRQIYFHQTPSKEVTDRIEEAIWNDRVDEEILKLARDSRTDKYLDVEWKEYFGMSMIHFALSVRLKNLASVCFALKADEMFEVIDKIDMRGDFNDRGGNFDEIFGIDSTTLIRCASDMRKTTILQEQCRRNREMYLACMDDMDFLDYQYMNEILARIDSELHQERAKKDLERQQEALIDEFTEYMYSETKGNMQKYLKGEENEDTLYSLAENVRWHGGHYWVVMNSYREVYGIDALYKRCLAALMVCREFQNYYYRVERYAEEKDISQHKEWLRELFQQVDEEKIALSFQLNGLMDICDSLSHEKKKLSKAFLEEGKEIFGSCLEERPEETLEAFRKADKEGRIFGLQILVQKVKKERTDQFMEAILAFAQDKEKTVREALVDVLDQAKVFEEDIIGLLASPKAADREIAAKVLVNWNDEKYVPILKETLTKEKSAKIRTLLQTLLPAKAVVKSEGKKALQDMVEELHKGNRKRSLAWAYETPFSKVHKKDGEEAEEEYLQAILLAYSGMSMKEAVVSKGTEAIEGGIAPYGINSTAAALAEDLKKEELAVYVNELLDKWTAAGSETRKRWVLYAAALHGGADMSDRLYQLFQEWTKKSDTVAAEALRALALSLRPRALMIVDGISRKFKTQKMKRAAKKALTTAASWCGTTREGLLDRTVPDLGFDEKMERCFDYGERRFTVTITTALEVQAFDMNGKKIKNLPAPTKKDDETKAAAAYEEFKQLKKQLKTVAADQKIRMETALINGREWSIQAWQDLFVKNPVMHQFAIGLVWGIYEDRKLVAGFRYMEDGSFVTENGEEFKLWEKSALFKNSKIGIVHPIELTERTLQAWKEQLDDYEILQPVEQLYRSVFRMTEEEAEQKSLDRYEGWNLDSEKLKKQLKKLDWCHADDDDVLSIYEKENEEFSLGVELLFEYDEWPGSETATLQDAKFYEDDGSGWIADDDYCFLKDVPERYFSEIVRSLAKAVE